MKGRIIVAAALALVLAGAAGGEITSIVTLPEGADGEVQYNNGFQFGGDAAFTFNDSTKRVAVSSAAITYAIISTASLTQLKFADGTSQTTSSTGQDNLGDHTATMTITAGYGISATTLTLSGFTALPYVSTTSAGGYTMGGTDFFLAVDASGANRTVNLPAVSGTTGRIYTIKKTDSSTNTVTIDGNGAETIDGYSTVVLSTSMASHSLISSGSAWYIW